MSAISANVEFFVQRVNLFVGHKIFLQKNFKKRKSKTFEKKNEKF